VVAAGGRRGSHQAFLWLRLPDERPCQGADRLHRHLQSLFSQARFPPLAAVRVSQHHAGGGAFSYPRVGGSGRPIFSWSVDRRLVCAGEHAVPDAHPKRLLRLAYEAQDQEFPRAKLEELLTPDAAFQFPAVAHGALAAAGQVLSELTNTI